MILCPTSKEAAKEFLESISDCAIEVNKDRGLQFRGGVLKFVLDPGL